MDLAQITRRLEAQISRQNNATRAGAIGLQRAALIETRHSTPILAKLRRQVASSVPADLQRMVSLSAQFGERREHMARRMLVEAATILALSGTGQSAVETLRAFADHLESKGP